jgi:hypothetical protein
LIGYASKNRALNQIAEIIIEDMGIKTTGDYVKFYINLEMQDSVSFLSFINNEKMVLKHKLENKTVDREPILNGIKILEELAEELKKDGEPKVLERYNK